MRRITLPLGIISAAMTAMLCMSSPSAKALDDADSRKSLTGLTGVVLLIEEPSPAVAKLGLTKEKLTTLVELRLRTAGIRILSVENAKTMHNDFGLLSIHTAIMQLAAPLNGVCIFSMDAEITQPVSIPRIADGLFFAVTWSSAPELGFVGTSKVESVAQHVGDQVDTFCNAFLAANPK